jgi:hypothetical protein
LPFQFYSGFLDPDWKPPNFFVIPCSFGVITNRTVNILLKSIETASELQPNKNVLLYMHI